ncbi:MAG TPA: hypothetical protein VID75_08455 [Acidimicrobiales bacterium]
MGGTVRSWWDGHALTGSVVSSLLVLAVTALIIDEVVADRQRRDRVVTVAVQGLIVYGQLRRTYGAVTGTEKQPPGVPAEELRTLTNMLLTASPSLFDDPAARRFLEEAERLTAALVGRRVGGVRQWPHGRGPPAAGHGHGPSGGGRRTAREPDFPRGPRRPRGIVEDLTSQTFTRAMCSSG